jgi:hypothetical protein
MSLPLHVNLSPEHHVTDLLLSHLLRVVCTASVSTSRKLQCLININVTRWRALFVEHAT